jgi:two-component system, OmpR family, alkaline phosphatase synthesis response regulator PhoP
MSTHLILLVDDEPHITRVVASRLQRAGYETVEAHDGAAGYEAALEHTPDLIFVDLQMPYMNGMEMAIKLRNTPQTANTPIVMLTGRGYMVDKQHMDQTNIRQLLAKPFSARELVECAKVLLGDTLEREAA